MRALLPLLTLIPLAACDPSGAEPGEPEQPRCAGFALDQRGCVFDVEHVARPTCPPGFAVDQSGCVFDEQQVAKLMRAFDQGMLVKINDAPFDQVMGARLSRNVWVSPVPLDNGPGTAADLYRTIDPDDATELLFDFPVGTLIVHETVNREEGHTVQVKLGDGYSDENGRDWWFGKYYDDGTADENDCTPCVACHNDGMRGTTDGLYGVRAEHKSDSEG